MQIVRRWFVEIIYVVHIVWTDAHRYLKSTPFLSSFKKYLLFYLYAIYCTYRQCSWSQPCVASGSRAQSKGTCYNATGGGSCHRRLTSSGALFQDPSFTGTAWAGTCTLCSVPLQSGRNMFLCPPNMISEIGWECFGLVTWVLILKPVSFAYFSFSWPVRQRRTYSWLLALISVNAEHRSFLLTHSHCFLKVRADASLYNLAVFIMFKQIEINQPLSVSVRYCTHCWNPSAHSGNILWTRPTAHTPRTPSKRVW